VSKVAWRQFCLPSLRSGLQLAAVVALLGVAVPTAALAQTEIDPGETLSDLKADGGNISEDCEEETDPLRRCLVLIDEDSIGGFRVQLLAEVGPQALGAAGGGYVVKTLTVSSADGAEGSALIGSFLSMRVDWGGPSRAGISPWLATASRCKSSTSRRTARPSWWPRSSLPRNGRPRAWWW
jgi:hypothetical protein